MKQLKDFRVKDGAGVEWYTWEDQLWTAENVRFHTALCAHLNIEHHAYSTATNPHCFRSRVDQVNRDDETRRAYWNAIARHHQETAPRELLEALNRLEVMFSLQNPGWAAEEQLRQKREHARLATALTMDDFRGDFEYFARSLMGE